MTDLEHRPLSTTQPPPADELIRFTREFTKAKAPTLDAMPSYVANGVTRWLNDMLVAAELGDTARVHRIAERINSRLKDERAFQLNQARKARERERG
jgi:hypothetical protein